ncbi:hypothetical protein ACFL0V_01380 [Nanoarchaeota archaeon]
MKAIRPEKRHVLSAEEAMAEVDMRPESDGLKIIAPFKGAMCEIEWNESLGGDVGMLPTAEIYGVTILALGELGENRLSKMMRDDLMGGYMVTNSYMMPTRNTDDARVCHGHERYKDGLAVDPFSHTDGVQAIFGVEDSKKFQEAVLKVTGCPLYMYARHFGPVMLGKKQVGRRDNIKVYSSQNLEGRTRGVRWREL